MASAVVAVKKFEMMLDFCKSNEIGSFAMEWEMADHSNEEYWSVIEHLQKKYNVDNNNKFIFYYETKK